ncbi:MAG: hypothetical protein ORN29_08260 [Rhodoferax sp.]|nr:hypothetical protein [Rhodoferax sp.]
MSVVATGTAALNYQWKKNGIDIPGATTSTYATPATSVADSGSLYSVLKATKARDRLHTTLKWTL